MNNIFQQLIEYLSFPFVRYAFIAGILIALCSSLLGVILVLKRFSFIGDGLSHVAFGAMAIAAVMSLSNEMTLVMPVTIVCAILLLKKSRSGSGVRRCPPSRRCRRTAVGYLLLNMFSTSANISGDVCSTLFGSTSILTLSQTDIILCVIMSVIVILIFVFMYNRIFAVTFDETFAKATGINSELYNLLIAVITAIIIVLAMNLVGALLTSALIVFPSLTAMRLFSSFKKVIMASAVIAVAASVIGISLSILFSTPVGATVVVVNAALYLICCIFKKD